MAAGEPQARQLARRDGLPVGNLHQSLSETLPAAVEAGIPIYVSGMSAKGRGVTEADLEGKGATFAMPSQLVELTFDADRVLTY